MLDIRNALILLFALLTLGMLSSCSPDEPDSMLSSCPKPVDAFIMSDCLLDIPDLLRPADQPDVTFEVELFRDNDQYYYAFLSSDFSAPIEVYDACCNSICRIGFPETAVCDWQDRAEDLGKIWEE